MSRLEQFPVVVVGSGFFGSVIAHLVATELNLPVLVVEKRSHPGGNSYSRVDSGTGIEYHCYGSHLFHTSNRKVWDFVQRFSGFNNYRHRVFARHDGRIFPMPVNLRTINQFFGLSLSPREARTFLEAEIERDAVADPGNLEEKAIAMMGRRLYEAFIRGYTRKQWEIEPAQLPPRIVARLPVRCDENDFYFSDTFEGLPLDGYAKFFERMLASANIHLALGCDFFEVRGQLRPDALIVYTGPIDRFYDYRCGALGWRTLDFELDRLAAPDYQGAAVVNYPDPDERFTRIHEFKHLHPERPAVPGTLIMREYSRFATQRDELYYPIGRAEDGKRYREYREFAAREPFVVFGGRLGTYCYLDMHQAIAAAMKCFEMNLKPRLTGARPKRAETSQPEAAGRQWES